MDDFIFLQETEENCNGLVRIFLDICAEVGIPVALEKTEKASTLMVFLGLLLDGVNFVINVPQEKRVKALNLLQVMLSKRKATMKDLEKLAGLLNVLSRAIVPGRAFTRRMYAKFAKITEEKNLKDFHHINLDHEFKSDCSMWCEFLSQTKTVSIARPFMDLSNILQAEEIFCYSDAAKEEKLGFGNLMDQSWIFQQWENGFIQEKNPNIEFLELYALCVGIFTWAPKLQNRRCVVFCDNLTVCNMVNHTTSGCKYSMTLVRNLTLKAIEYNFRIFAEHIKGRLNVFSDRLSRLKIQEFKRLAQKYQIPIDEKRTMASAELWPLTAYWATYCQLIEKFK